jgi:hypothetical protein
MEPVYGVNKISKCVSFLFFSVQFFSVLLEIWDPPKKSPSYNFETSQRAVPEEDPLSTPQASHPFSCSEFADFPSFL